MFRKAVCGIMLFLLLIGIFSLAVNIKPVKSEWTGTVYIRADGSIDPPDAPISRINNFYYILDGDIYGTIIVEKDDIVLDGKSHIINGLPIQPMYNYIGIDIGGRHNVTVKNFFIEYWQSYGIYCGEGAKDNCIENNTIYDCSMAILVTSSHEPFYPASQNNILVNNHIKYCDYGLVVHGVNNSISDNKISGDITIGGMNNYCFKNIINGTGEGIVVLGSQNYILNNLILATSWSLSGVKILGDKNVVKNNTIDSAPGHWGYFEHPLYLYFAENNTVEDNNMLQIMVHCSVENIIRRNHVNWLILNYSSNNNVVIENNINWLQLDFFSNYNTFYHNNLNHCAINTSFYNIWDDGYPSGGNYWSDYAGVDNNGDGIGDTPYVIDENNIDHYPLMYPWGTGKPIASFAWSPSVPEVGEVVTFDASASMPVGGEIVSYEWDFGDGKRATGMIVTHVYGSAGTFTVTLNVTDSEGLWNVEQKQIEVKAPPQPLTVSISPLSASILLGESVTFTSTTLGGCPPYTYQWYLNGNPVSGATSDTWTFTPAAIGAYYVYVKVIDCKNDIAQSETAYISVTSAPVVAPIAAFTWSPRSPLESETVVFDASASKPDSGEIVRFVWSFGDGESGEGRLVTHTYSRAGLYKVTLTVFSSEGLSDDVSDYIFVRPKCFILTAVLGTDAEGDLNYLRLFRDKILRTNPVGEAFVAFYYEASPPIAEQLSRNQLLRALTAILFVQPLIVTVKILLSPYSIALYAALATLFFYAVKRRKLKALLTFIQVSAITATAISLTALTLGLIAKTIPQTSIIASIMLPTIIPAAIITATIKTFKKQRKKPTISSANL